MIKVIINGVDYRCNHNELDQLLNETHNQHFREIWVEHGDARMCALTVGDEAWLMLMRWPGDAGYSSRNRTYSGSKDDMRTFTLFNGQIDEYPRAWVLPSYQWIAGLLYFAKTGKPSPAIEWHDDN